MLARTREKPRGGTRAGGRDSLSNSAATVRAGSEGGGDGAARVVVVGASAGGIEAFRALAGGLPPDLLAAVLVVVHIPATLPSLLPQILASAGPLPAAHAQDGETLRPGRIYVAPPDRHLLVEGGKVRLSAGPRENFSRPSVDPLFRSAAKSFGRRAAGVILSGSLDDGAAGLAVVRRRGGLTVAQDPREALFSSMPEGVIRRVGVDFVLPAADIAALLASWASGKEMQEKRSVATV